MKKVAIVPFFKYEPVYQDNYKVLFNFFILHARKWAKFVDELIITDSGCNFVLPEVSDGIENITIRYVPARSHWENMNEAIRKTDGDLILLLDSDMIIYEPSIVEFGFRQLEKDIADVVGILDSSGGVRLIKYPLMQANENREERFRLCPYLCFLKKSALRPDFDFTPVSGDKWMDSMGKITEQLLEDSKVIFELQDDRSTISLEDDGKITSVQWLDTPPKKWALKENPNLGYYHIRNFGGALQVLNNYHTNPNEFNKLINTMPKREIKRLLAWLYVIADKLNNDTLKTQINSLVTPTLAKNLEWPNYISRFMTYHAWLEKI
jgi:glycosyltransferase involved in cell wall biosynthesis